MLKSENVATPFTAVAVLVPDSVPGISRPPLCPIATVTAPVKLATELPSASTAVTVTAGRMVARGSVVLGWTVNTRCSGGLSATTVASHVPGFCWVKYHVHCGSTEPAPCTAYSPSATIAASDSVARLVNAGGGATPTRSFDMVTPYASAPAPTGIAPGSAVVRDEPEPDAD